MLGECPHVACGTAENSRYCPFLIWWGPKNRWFQTKRLYLPISTKAFHMLIVSLRFWWATRNSSGNLYVPGATSLPTANHISTRAPIAAQRRWTVQPGQGLDGHIERDNWGRFPGVTVRKVQIHVQRLVLCDPRQNEVPAGTRANVAMRSKDMLQNWRHLKERSWLWVKHGYPKWNW